MKYVYSFISFEPETDLILSTICISVQANNKQARFREEKPYK